MFVFFLYHIGVKKNNWKVIKKNKQKAWKPSCVYVCVRSLTSRLPFCTANLCFSSLLLATLWLRGGPGQWDAAPPDGATGAELVSTLGRSCFCPLSRLSFCSSPPHTPPNMCRLWIRVATFCLWQGVPKCRSLSLILDICRPQLSL